ncbi:hypothetical protein MMC10_009353 [Thelotrema lepadinum]|nr:hypothetical protein [Thelotrema lepadinum]
MAHQDLTWLTSFVLLVLLPSLACGSTAQFQSWYPTYAKQLQAVIQRNCSSQFHAYVTSNTTAILAAAQQNPDINTGSSILTGPLVDCLLDALTESIKANMASAGVLLGLAPTVLSTIGSSTAETALLSVVAGRPLLALCVAAGSPAVAPLGPFQYPDSMDTLLRRPAIALPTLPIPNFLRSHLRAAITAFEYGVALATIANVADIGYTLGVQAIVNFASETTFLPLLWSFLAVPIHVGGSLALWRLIQARADVNAEESPRSQRTWWKPDLLQDLRKLQRLLRRWAEREFMPSGWKSPASLPNIERAALRPGSFLFFSWLTEVGTVLHIFFGTIVFASVLFIVVTDAAGVAFRYLASVVCCRAIVAYEIAGLRSAYEKENKEKESIEGMGNLVDRSGLPEVGGSERNEPMELQDRDTSGKKIDKARATSI